MAVSLLQLALTGIFAVSSEDTRRYHTPSTPCFHTPLTLRPTRGLRRGIPCERKPAMRGRGRPRESDARVRARAAR
eukprot:404799-Prymnesium_polylepis.1